MLRDGPLETDTSSGSNSAPAQPEKTNEQSNVECKECRDCPRGAGCSFEPDYCLGNASARLLRRLLSGQPQNLASVRHIEIFQENRVGLLRCQMGGGSER